MTKSAIVSVLWRAIRYISLYCEKTQQKLYKRIACSNGLNWGMNVSAKLHLQHMNTLRLFPNEFKHKLCTQNLSVDCRAIEWHKYELTSSCISMTNRIFIIISVCVVHVQYQMHIWVCAAVYLQYTYAQLTQTPQSEKNLHTNTCRTGNKIGLAKLNGFKCNKRIEDMNVFEEDKKVWAKQI